ncbi:MAG: bifunctional (p)ppGpp synthetase/guanosine-3',5'-bis(diphosphate) 3'-pyrophosphohydrolase, partial [Deltaproteobacteria bacterium]|nr:bifunctional (p)ppGpp synthetase/guanosine-3',5'-bis(diphosphate) 3'-pyrophosphohydrolase [Deltaproteobacteria bacterium]
MIDLAEISQSVLQYNPHADVSLLEKAYIFSKQVHEGQKRASGEPYVIHPIEVAVILSEMKLDVPSIVAGLLHDTVEDTTITLDDIQSKFGLEVSQLVDGVTKLGKIRFGSTQEKQAENFRKMIMAMSQDIRVLLIKLAD